MNLVLNLRFYSLKFLIGYTNNANENLETKRSWNNIVYLLSITLLIILNVVEKNNIKNNLLFFRRNFTILKAEYL